MAQPEMLYRNLLAVAAEGRGDGTIYAWGTSATVDQANKQFDLTTINIMTDLGADADDLFNGYVLVFTSSGRSYLITDWTAATDVATVFETPNTTDTGAWTIRRTLYTNDFNVANPLRYAANGRLYQKWIDASANNAAQIFAALPNLIDDGGFERNSLSTYWTTRGVAGTGTVAINSTTPILGTYDCKFNQGDQTYVGLEQNGKGDLRKGYTYGIIMKTGGDAGVVTDFRVSLEYVAGSATQVPVTFTEINGGDDTATSNIWKPAITDANAWDEIIFTVSEDLDAGAWKLVLDQYDATDVFIDEVYIWEIGPTVSTPDQPDTLIIGNHNHAGGYSGSGVLVEAHRCQYDLTSRGASEFSEQLDDTITVDGNSPVYQTWTASTSIYPIFYTGFAAISGKTWEAGEIWLGQRWTWTMYPDPPITAKQLSIESTSTRSRGGARVSSKIYQQTIYNGQLELVTGTEADKWKLFVSEMGHGASFWLRIPAQTNLGVTAQTVFVDCKNPPTVTPDPPVNYRVSFNFEEAF